MKEGRLARTIVLLGVSIPLVPAALAQRPTPMDLATASLPSWVVQGLRDSAMARYELHLSVNPFSIAGDLDGDGRLEVVVLIRHRISQKTGLVFFSRTRRPVIVGAGTPFGDGGDDFQWLDVWRLAEIDSATRITSPSRFAVLVEKLESASGLIYWDGKRYRWHQLGD